MENMQHTKETKATFNDYFPLILAFLLVFLFTFLMQTDSGFSISNSMRFYMGGFFVIFGFVKIIDLKGFVKAFKQYDLIAQKSELYGELYPFIELILGIFYIINFMPLVTNIITLIIMSFGAISILIAIRTRGQFECACLGTLFSIPLTNFSLFEDISMALMAIFSILY